MSGRHKDFRHPVSARLFPEQRRSARAGSSDQDPLSPTGERFVRDVILADVRIDNRALDLVEIPALTTVKAVIMTVERQLEPAYVLEDEAVPCD